MEKFILIVNCGHSGSTLLNKIIGNHKDIYGIIDETSLFFKSEVSIKYMLNNFDNLRISNKKTWICEKTPTHVYKLNKIYEYIKDPKIIVIIRDGRDVVASLNKRYGDLNKSLNRWINDNLEWVNHVNKCDFYVIKYEDLVKDPQLQLKKICEYVGLEYYKEILDYKKQEIILPNDFYSENIEGDKHNKLREYQINQDIYNGVGRFKNDLTEVNLNLLMSNQKFIKLMEEFKYI